VPLEFRFPDTGEGIDAGELVEWHVAEGQMVREDEPMAEVETDKATITIPCPTTGRVIELRVAVGALVPVGEVMAVFEPAGEHGPEPAPDGPAAGAASPGADRPRAPLASPAVRRRAAELSIDLSQVQGSGPEGRVEAGDLEQAAAGARDRDGGAGDQAAGGAGDQAPRAKAEVVPLRGVRRAIAHAMTESWRTIPHIIDYRDVDATALLSWRDEARAQTDDDRLRAAITITPLLMGIAVEALKRHPYVNSSVDMEREQITLHREYNIGVATATPDGLIVPVLHDADAKAISELALEVSELVAAARERRLRPEQLARGTFTVNNYGSLGVWLGTPIIKPGEVANLGVGRVQDRPVVRDGQIVARPVVALAVSGDHRVLDGHTLGAFVSDVVALIENPAPLRSGAV
jgi:pyruvate dehydrogenase E2 component (dihydrolipoamide acetyltransferase)